MAEKLVQKRLKELHEWFPTDEQVSRHVKQLQFFAAYNDVEEYDGKDVLKIRNCSEAIMYELSVALLSAGPFPTRDMFPRQAWGEYKTYLMCIGYDNRLVGFGRKAKRGAAIPPTIYEVVQKNGPMCIPGTNTTFFEESKM
eukprot:CAMPEP_0168514240 /NCGR_PEP_ID=MMETSP0405-20121227/3985_1 /TAXON_ID=498012 /ORGANISM="Trichosphaerium sp, Strain Am-I-7 wt" /LENGTH=140 /DNA_ID=CAMNT_0008533315 /DNA_START=54 /DNA_END=473 /DNA_ORIENTATION=-